MGGGWVVMPVLVAVLGGVSACSGGGALSASSTCEEFLKASAQDQDQAVKQVALAKHAPDAVTPLGRPNVDYLCVKTPTMRLGDAVALSGGAPAGGGTSRQGAVAGPTVPLPSATALPYLRDADIASRMFATKEVAGFQAVDLNRYSPLTGKTYRVLPFTGCATQVLAAEQPADQPAQGQIYGARGPDGRARSMRLVITRVDTGDAHQLFQQFVAVRDQCTSYGTEVVPGRTFTVTPTPYRPVGDESAAWSVAPGSMTEVAFRSGRYLVFLNAPADVIDLAVRAAARKVAS